MHLEHTVSCHEGTLFFAVRWRAHNMCPGWTHWGRHFDCDCGNQDWPKYDIYIYCVYIYIYLYITFTYFEFLMPPWFSGSCATDWLDLVSFCFLHTYLDLLRFFLVLSLSKVLPVLGVIVSQVNRKRMLTSSPHRFQRCCRSLQVWLPPTSGRTWCCFSSVEAVEASLLTFCVGNSAAFGC